MADLVSLPETKLFLRVDHSQEDWIIDLLIAAASDAVRDVATDWNGEGDAPDRLKLAVLTRVAIAFDNRDSMEPGSGEHAMLTPFRALEV